MCWTGYQTNAKLMREDFETNEDVNLQFAAYRLHIKYGNYEDGKQRLKSEEDIKGVLPPGIRSSREPDEWARLINHFYQKLVGKTKTRTDGPAG